MKKTVITLIAAFLLSPMLMMAGNTASTIKTNPPAKEYTGYWVVTCGAEKIVLSEAAIPEEALVRDANGELVRLNMDVLDKTFNYTYSKTIQGKLVTANQFVLVDKNATEAKAGIKVNTWFGGDVCNNNFLCQATMTCYGSPVYVLHWEVLGRTCSYTNTNYCVVRQKNYPFSFFTIACR